MARIKRKFQNIILLFLLLVVWVVVGLLGRIIFNKSSVPFIKESQAACCPCAPTPPSCDGGNGDGEGCGAPSCGSTAGIDIDAACSGSDACVA